MRSFAAVASAVSLASLLVSSNANPIEARQPNEQIYNGWLFEYETFAPVACGGTVDPSKASQPTNLFCFP